MYPSLWDIHFGPCCSSSRSPALFLVSVQTNCSKKKKDTQEDTKRHWRVFIYFLYQPFQLLSSTLLLLFFLFLSLFQLSICTRIVGVVLVISPPCLCTQTLYHHVTAQEPDHVAGTVLTYGLHLHRNLEQPILQLHANVFALETDQKYSLQWQNLEGAQRNFLIYERPMDKSQSDRILALNCFL